MGTLFPSHRILDAYHRELDGSGLLDHIRSAKDEYDREVRGTTCRGNPYGFGSIRLGESRHLYALVRHLNPQILVETGVCNGVSTCVMLQALEENGRGRLYSIDLPEYTDTDYPEGMFWEGKAGAAVPRDRTPGWIIPEQLRRRWTLVTGRSQDVLPGLLEEVGPIDLFLHDSEHSYECMMFEYQTVYPALRRGGLLISDDIHWNTAFTDFARAARRPVMRFGAGIALLAR